MPLPWLPHGFGRQVFLCLRTLAFLQLLSVAVAIPVLAQPPFQPLPIDQKRSALHRWLQKPVLKSHLLDTMETPDTWSHHGEGRIEFTTERAHDGQGSLRLASRTRTDRPPPVVGRPFAEAIARRGVAGEDWREFNRISLWVHPHLPGFKVISLLIKLHNDGATKVPDRSGRDGLNYVLLEPDRWNHVVWEIPHLNRDRVTALDVIYRLQGNEPGAAEEVAFEVDQLELQAVPADAFEGWEVAPGRIAFSHLGYRPRARKIAIGSDVEAATFQVLRVPGAETESQGAAVVFDRACQTVTNALGRFAVLDFTDLREPGLYQVRLGAVTTPPFPIQEDVWAPSIEATLNFFACERCGFEVRGIHGVCHQDWQAEHAGRRLVINGGWHDAGDLSQGCVNTAESAAAMLLLAERLGPRNPAQADRLRAEARWGVEWLLKTRFGKGYRVTWATMDYWTDGRMGTVDDTLGEVRDSPLENFLAAAAEARAARAFAGVDRDFSQTCGEAAEADFKAALAKATNPALEVASAGALAAAALFHSTTNPAYLDHAVVLARAITASQDRAWRDWTLPLTGFFYTSPRQERILHYSHRGHEQAPIDALASLCAALPEHPDWMEWYATLALHSEYLRQAASVNAPFPMLSASIYRLDETQDPRFRAQITNGIRLDDRHYLRRFPVWFDLRGNTGTTLSQARALALAGRVRGDDTLLELAEAQLQWNLGLNPFAQSLMFGVGHDYAPQYTAMSGDMMGSLPVGIQTREDQDRPYWSAANCYNYKEVWVHPSARWLAILADLEPPPSPHKPAASRAPSSSSPIPSRVQPTGAQPAQNVSSPRRLGPPVVTGAGAELVLRVKILDPRVKSVTVRGFNLVVAEATRPIESSNVPGGEATWNVRLEKPDRPWVAVVIPDQDHRSLRDAVGYAPMPGASARR